ncbi:MAG: hypothetical protein GYA36_22415 [Veillonellaceae bacterium]|nr:hypothetical protein [Veillonellaceae bacterium]
MPLPTSRQIDWSEWSKNYKIDTPTFQLTPIEKPDMSPFLIHMTGENAIKSVLQGKGSTTEISEGFGYLQANIPEYNSGGTFDAKVVCFSESPTFALDFFRYRNFERWKANQSFGIGFDKSVMVAIGARPVIYVQDDVLKNVHYLVHRIKDDDLVISPEIDVNSKVVNTLVTIYPLLYPLLENHPSQGFMWEREWRYTNPGGLVFSHKDIRIICCPPDEEQGIRDILGNETNQIAFVHTWQEYDDVTDYLRRQEYEWGEKRAKYEESKQESRADETKQHLANLIQQYTLAYNSLDSFGMFISTISQEMDKVAMQKEILSKEINELTTQLQ